MEEVFTLQQLHDTVAPSVVTNTSSKAGRCPSRVLAPELCPEGVPDQCTDDSSCSGTSKCCSTGCARVCIRPLSSACELQRQNTLRRARALGLNDASVPECDEVQGTFVPIQCSGGYCYCADPVTGYEMPGTRARSIEMVNCSEPRPCAGYQCRMLCPYQFQLDSDGCPVCRCRDPCEGIQCPSGHTCVLEELPCATEPCPPLPTCKEPRSLQSLCPLGDPLMLDDVEQRPFLCGTDPGKPTCPHLYKCHVMPGHDYGACCADVEALVKPGTCPIDAVPSNAIQGVKGKKSTSPVDQQLIAEVEAIVKEEVEELRCGVSCSHDLQCPSTQKCCMSDICGQHCIQPANLTECLHQRMIAELLIVSEREGKGYIPQCSPQDGVFTPKQCSRNGLVCWCVDPLGNKRPRSLGPAEEVTCPQHEDVPSARSSCGELQCSLVCEWGYTTDHLGCSLCACQDPCEDIQCPPQEICVMGERCGRGGCTDMPACIPHSLLDYSPHPSAVAPTFPTSADLSHNLMTFDEVMQGSTLCPLSMEPLTVGGLLLECDLHNPCPQGYTCSLPDTPRGTPLCCPVPTQIESTRPGQCPFLNDAPEDLCSMSSVCATDDHCPHQEKCCVVPVCGGPVCVEAVPSHNYTIDQGLLQGPTMCEYLRDLVMLEGVELAIVTPSCDENGAYEQVQCNELGQCWCVDDFGSYIPGTKVSSRELVTCDKLREASGCGEVLCRLGCDYGFVLHPDTACPLCMCRDPCDGVHCSSGQTCELVDIPCVDGICPPIPQCVPIPQTASSAPSCPRGEPYSIPGTNRSLSCSPRARALECPRGYSCLAQANEVEGVCCYTTANPEGKLGQCPFLVPAASSQSCDLECTSDAHCTGDDKCCSNGCGMHCVEPIIKTACQHQRTLLEHRAREAGIPSGRVYLPQCDEAGNFMSQQCHPATTTCWCVDNHGSEVPGTRVSQPAKPDCQRPAQCPALACSSPACLHGTALDSKGCPTCDCRDPCQEVQCNEPMEECRIVHVVCVTEPCPPLPVCLPRLENPCPTGEPLSVNGTLVQCGPEGSVCPSSHKCHLSPLGEYALCCRKPREVCYDPRDSGFCEGSIRRWHFDPESNQCKSFRFGGCGGNLNNFESEIECKNACPVLSSCEKMRAKNIQKASKNKKMTFIPKCNNTNGSWQPIQCLEELGVCWCVTRKGTQVEGSLTRGTPNCDQNSPSNRSARKLEVHRDFTWPHNTICEPGQTVHVCDKSLCSNKVCLSHPTASCRVNPCGGCSVLFVDDFNNPVDCDEDLSSCQRELQAVLNSPAFSKPVPGIIGDSVRFQHDEEPLYDASSNADVYYTPTQVRYKDSSNLLLTSPEKSNKGQFLAKQQLPKRDGEVSYPEVTIVYQSPTASSKSVSQHLLRSKRDNKESDSTAESNKSTIAQQLSEFVKDGSSQEFLPSVELADDGSPIIQDYDTQLPPKPGTCPSPKSDVSLLTCQPRQECLQDHHCEGSAKCCFTGCGATCQQPQEVPASSEGMGLRLPLCESDGSYTRTQTAAQWSWCVDTNGNPLHHTLTRGHVRCGPNGQILEQSSQGPVCSNRPGMTPRVCADECLSVSCPAHPDALCVADPCNDCSITFYSPDGEKVHCEERCSQPLATGMCRASFKRFFFNSSANTCQEFVYGGCQGNDNNFATMEECHSYCHAPKSVCELPVRPGTCSGGEARWYYNPDTRSCDPFLYTGCEGNGNNFLTKLQCDATCPDQVLCPFWSSKSMEPKPCPRSDVCTNATCLGYPEAVCSVEPCDCTPYFTDQIGQTVECLTPTKPPKTILAFSYEQDLPDGLSSEVSGGGSDPITIYLEGEPSVGRCELLRRHLAANEDRQFYQPQCDEHGNFMPTQCYTGTSDQPGRDAPSPAPRCWCVDETGKKTHPSAYFLSGERKCDHVLVESVVVTLGFHGHKVGIEGLGRKHETVIRQQIANVLAGLRPAKVDGKVTIVDLPDVTQVKFTLRGDKKIDAAYQLEEKVRRGELALHLPIEDKKVPADMRASWFHHQVAPPFWRHSNKRFTSRLTSDSNAREVVSRVERTEPPFLAASIVVTVISAVLVCSLVVAVVLYKRHVSAAKAKAARGSMQSLTFSDTSLDRRSISSGKFCSELEHPRLDGRLTPSTVNTIEVEFRAVTRH